MVTYSGSGAPLASPAFTGVPTAPTAAALDNSTQIATDAYVDAAVAVETTRATTAEALKAALASPALTGHPTGVTEAASTNSTRLATTAYADAAVLVESTRALAAEALLAPIASPTFTGTPAVPTPQLYDRTTTIPNTTWIASEFGLMVADPWCISGVNPSYSTCKRADCSGSQAVSTTGIITLAAVSIPAGASIGHLGFFHGGTDAVTPTHWWLVLCDAGLVVRAVTADQTNTAIAGIGAFNVATAASYTIPGSGLVPMYVGVMFTAGTIPTIEGDGRTIAQTAAAPRIVGSSGSGYTTAVTVGTTLAALSGGIAIIPNLYAY